MTNLWYLVAAYLVLWIALFVYLYWVNGAIRSIRQEAAELRRKLQEVESQSSRDPAGSPTAQPQNVRL